MTIIIECIVCVCVWACFFGISNSKMFLLHVLLSYSIVWDRVTNNDCVQSEFCMCNSSAFCGRQRDETLYMHRDYYRLCCCFSNIFPLSFVFDKWRKKGKKYAVFFPLRFVTGNSAASLGRPEMWNCKCSIRTHLYRDKFVYTCLCVVCLL